MQYYRRPDVCDNWNGDRVDLLLFVTLFLTLLNPPPPPPLPSSNRIFSTFRKSLISAFAALEKALRPVLDEDTPETSHLVVHLLWL